MSRALKSRGKVVLQPLKARHSTGMVAPMSGEDHPDDTLPDLMAELAKARDALRESEELHRGILETAVNAIITIDEREIGRAHV